MTTEKLRIIVTHWVLIWKLCHNYYNLMGAVVTNTEDLIYVRHAGRSGSIKDPIVFQDCTHQQ